MFRGSMLSKNSDPIQSQDDIKEDLLFVQQQKTLELGDFWLK